MSGQAVVMWFRRDLRLRDLPALHAAVAASTHVVPVFVIDPAFGHGTNRHAVLAAALAALDASMGGKTLVIRYGDPADVVPRLASEVGAGEVHVTRDYAPYGRRRDAAVASRLAADGRRLVGTGSPYAVPPGRVTKADGSPYAVFTPFSKAWRLHGWDAPLGVPDVTWVGADAVASDDRLPSDGPPRDSAMRPLASESEAENRWQTFVSHGLDAYDQQRNLPGVEGTSRLSMDLRWGTVHPRQLLAELDDRPAHTVFASELAWREFYADVLMHTPESAWSNLTAALAAMPLDTDRAAVARFARWQNGQTGFPIVDAGMRQLSHSGWMHNRVRMIVASFLVKDLHLPWQWGARHFMNHLIDGDLASNSHGWQWTAGTGTDAAPYFRIFNPTAQSERFDPDGDYIRRWVPELGDLDARNIHQPALRPTGYPAPMVDHRRERDEALARYQLARASAKPS